MDKIIGYNHTFSSTNIKPAFYDVEIIGSTLYYAYYFMLYPTGLAIVLAVPNELSSISYNPYSNHFTTEDSLSSGMVKLASITPKIYQFVGASQILVSAGAGSSTRSNTSDSAHYKGYYTTASNNPISLNTSTKRIVGQGTEYGSLPEMLFIDPALGMGQTLSANSVDIVRYPLYKKNNLYYKSTTTLDTNAQYLSVASDAFSHSGELSDLNQSGTKGYASRNKLGILLNTTTHNPQVPSNNNTFSQATTNNNTKDVYQTDNSRFMTEKFGIKDNNNGYQLSVAPSFSTSGGYYLGSTSQSKVSYPTTQCSKNNPGVLFRNDEGNDGATSITQDDIFRIDQFVLQIKTKQFKIPANGVVRYYCREAQDNNLITIQNLVTRNGQSKFTLHASCVLFPPSMFHVNLYYVGNEYYGQNDPGIIINIPTPTLSAYQLNGNVLTPITEQGEETTYSSTQRINLDLRLTDQLREGETSGVGTSKVNGASPSGGDTQPFIEKANFFAIQYKILNVPEIPGIPIQGDGDAEYNIPQRTGYNYGNTKTIYDENGWQVNAYFGIKSQPVNYTVKTLLEFFNTYSASAGLMNNFNLCLVSNPTYSTAEFYKSENDKTLISYDVDYCKEDQGNIMAFSARAVSNNLNKLQVVVAYPLTN